MCNDWLVEGSPSDTHPHTEVPDSDSVAFGADYRLGRDVTRQNSPDAFLEDVMDYN